jgi:predicted nucleotidyltransferase
MEKITKEQAVELTKRFIETDLSGETWYQAIKEHLLAIILYGSTAKGTNRPDSDIDILFILPLAIEKEYTAGEYFYKFEEREINIVIRSIEKLRQIAEAGDNDFQKEVFRESLIIWSKDGKLTQLLKKLG